MTLCSGINFKLAIEWESEEKLANYDVTFYYGNKSLPDGIYYGITAYIMKVGYLDYCEEDKGCLLKLIEIFCYSFLEIADCNRF